MSQNRIKMCARLSTLNGQTSNADGLFVKGTCRLTKLPVIRWIPNFYPIILEWDKGMEKWVHINQGVCGDYIARQSFLDRVLRRIRGVR